MPDNPWHRRKLTCCFAMKKETDMSDDAKNFIEEIIENAVNPTPVPENQDVDSTLSGSAETDGKGTHNHSIPTYPAHSDPLNENLVPDPANEPDVNPGEMIEDEEFTHRG
jgi:hypothetical protein